MDQSKGKLLLCDDERLVLATLADGLRHAGFNVIETDNGDDAILLAREHRPDLAVLDIRMNGKSGLDVASYIRDQVGTPCIFLSACSDDDVLRQATAVGALDFIVKPVAVRHLLPSIEAALGRARLARAAVGGAPAFAATSGGRQSLRGAAPHASPNALGGSVGIGIGAMPGAVRGAVGGGGGSGSGRSFLSTEALPIAIGILMERYGIDAAAASARLGEWASQSKLSSEAAAFELVSQADIMGGAARAG